MAMSFYDRHGRLLESNQKMSELCFPTERLKQYFDDTNLFDMPGIKGDLDPEGKDPFYVCQHFHLKDMGFDRFVENKIKPLFDEDGMLMFYIVTTRDVTDERQMYLKEREHERQIVETNEAIRRYDQQLSYLLEENKIFVWTYDPKTDMSIKKNKEGSVRADISGALESLLTYKRRKRYEETKKRMEEY